MIRAAGTSGLAFWLVGGMLALTLHCGTALALLHRRPPPTLAAPEGGFVIELAEIATARPGPVRDLALGAETRAQAAIAAADMAPEAPRPPEPQPDDLASPAPPPEPDVAPRARIAPPQLAQPEISESRTSHMIAAAQDVVNRAKHQAVPERQHDPQAIAHWMHALELALQRHKQYPEAARHARAEGHVILRLVLGPEGQLQQARVIVSSGHTQLDEAALVLAYRAAPFPPPPALGANRQLGIRVPIDYTLNPPYSRGQ